MIRIVLIVVIVAVVLALLSRFRAGIAKNTEKSERIATTKMVRCARCQLHITQQDALREGKEYFCCAEHLPQPGKTEQQ